MRIDTDATPGNEKLVLKGGLILPAAVDFRDTTRARTERAWWCGRRSVRPSSTSLSRPAYAGKGTLGKNGGSVKYQR